MYICIYIHIYTYLCMCLSIALPRTGGGLGRRVRLDGGDYMYIYICIYTDIYICMYVFMYSCSSYRRGPGVRSAAGLS